jgi:Rrf2 family protein
MEIPYRFLRKIVRRMVEAELVCSRRGKGGGLALARPAEEISFLDVMRAMDPHGAMLNVCLSDHGDGCTRRQRCPMHRKMQGIQAELERQMAAVVFGDIGED